MNTSGGNEDDAADEEMAAQQPPAVCSVKLCKATVSGRGPYSKLDLCQQHLTKDVAKVRQLTVRVSQRAAAAAAAADAARPKQLRLASELQQMEEAFDSLHRALDVWQKRLTAPLQVQHDSLVDALKIGSECRKFQLELAAAQGSGDVTRSFELASAMEPLLAGDDADGEEEGAAAPDLVAGLELPALAIDASGIVKNLLVPMDMEFGQLLASIGVGGVPRSIGTYARYSTSLVGFEASVTLLAVCDNTAGYRLASGRLVKGGKEGLEAPKRLLFASCNPDDSKKDHLIVLSLDGRLRAKFMSSGVGWATGVWGLHCDSARQIMYISLADAGVCVTDLAGTVLSRLTSNTLGCEDASKFRISGLAGTDDKLFAYNQRQRTVLVIGKKDLLLHSSLSLGPGSITFDAGVASATDPSLLLVSDWKAGCLHRLCPASGCRLPPLPLAEGLAAPYAVAVDNRRGVAFVSDFERRSVRAVLMSGRDCQPAMTAAWETSDKQQQQPQRQQQLQQQQFGAPCGLAVAAAVAEGEPALLFVADSANKKLNDKMLEVATGHRFLRAT